VEPELPVSIGLVEDPQDECSGLTKYAPNALNGPGNTAPYKSC